MSIHTPSAAPKRSVKKFQRRAIDALEESLRLDPAARGSYDLLGRLHDAWQQPAQAAAVAHRLLAVSPNDLPTIEQLVEHHIRQDEPLRALPLVEHARRLKPLDEDIAIDELRVRQGVARHHAQAGRWDEGRSEFAQVQSLWRDNLSREGLVSRMAAFEFKAGRIERAEELLREGESLSAEPTAFWLNMSIECGRYRLGADLGARFSGLLKAGLAKKVRWRNGRQVVYRCRRACHYGRRISRQKIHLRGIVAYLKRSSALLRNSLKAFQPDELVDICQFLALLPNEAELFERLVRKGVKAFPDSVYFLAYDSKIEFDRGPFRADTGRLRKQLEHARKLLENSRDPRELALTGKVRELLGIVRSTLAGASPSPFDGPEDMPDVPRGMFQMFQRLLDSQADETGEAEMDDFDFGFGFDRPPPKARSKRKRRSPGGR